MLEVKHEHYLVVAYKQGPENYLAIFQEHDGKDGTIYLHQKTGFKDGDLVEIIIRKEKPKET